MTVWEEIAGTLTILLSSYLCLLLVSSWGPKIADFSKFKDVVSGYRMIPDAAVSISAFSLILVEVVLTVMLVLPAIGTLSLGLTALLLVFYASVVGIALYRGDAGISCGCGAQDHVISSGLVWKNSFLSLLALFAVYVSSDFQLGVWETTLIWILGFSLFSMETALRQLIGNSEQGLTKIHTRNPE